MTMGLSILKKMVTFILVSHFEKFIRLDLEGCVHSLM